MKLIDSLDDLRAKVKIIEALLDIEAAVTMLASSATAGDGADGPKAEVDQHYEKLHCGLKPVEPGTEAYKHMGTYVRFGARKGNRNPLNAICAFPWADRAGRCVQAGQG